MRNQIVSHEGWLKARLELLAAEKEFTRQRDALTRRRMAMPWERVEKSYQFEGPNGTVSLAGLFDGRSQLDCLSLHVWARLQVGVSNLLVDCGWLQRNRRPSRQP